MPRGTALLANSITEFVEKFIEFPQPGFWARGEPCNYEEPLLAGIWRPDHHYQDRTPLDDKTTFTVGEKHALEACQRDFLAGRLNDRYFSKVFQSPEATIDLTNVELFYWLALAQHYNKDASYPTRLVDVTRDPFVALFFAAQDCCEQSGYVYYFNANYNDLSDEIQAKRGSTFLDVEQLETAGGLYHPGLDTLTLFTPPFPNQRSEAQRGAFIWTRNIGRRYGPHGIPIEIPASAKSSIRTGLERLNYTWDVLFPI